MYQFPVIVTLDTGEQVMGVAKNIKRNALGEECMQLFVEGENILVVLDKIKKLEVTVKNPHFSEVVFYEE